MGNSVAYYYNENSLPPDSWQVFYDFVGFSGNYLPSSSGSNVLHSGLKVGGNISVSNNSGYFAGNSYLSVQNITGTLTDWTIICSLQKNSITDATIFSNFCDGAIKSGFVLGLNASNKLYLESYDETGPIVIECPTILGRKNVVGVTKVGQSIYFDYLNANTKKITTFKVETSDKGFLNSSKWSVGGAPNAPTYFSGNNFSGIMDNFILLDSPIRPDEIEKIFKGIYSTGSPPSENLPYSYSLGMNKVAFLNKIDSTDAFDFYGGINQNNLDYLNKDASFDSAYGEFFGDRSISGALIAFLNGAAQIPHSGYSIGGTFYDPTFDLTGNFVPSGNQFFSNKFYSIDDRLVYDDNYFYPLNSYKYNFNFSHDGSSNSSVIASVVSGEDLVFFEGMKLVSNIDYTISEANIVFPSGNPLYEGMSGNLIIVPKNPNLSQILTGQNNISNLQTTFGRTTSQVWMNGLRQNLDEDYIEISDIDLLAGSGVFSSDQPILFNDF